MPTMIIKHRIKDYGVWKPMYEADVARRKAHGLTDLAVGVSEDDPSMV